MHHMGVVVEQLMHEDERIARERRLHAKRKGHKAHWWARVGRQQQPATTGPVARATVAIPVPRVSVALPRTVATK